jgi:hypothetical protein
MSADMRYFLVAAGLLLFSLLGLAIYFFRRTRRVAGATWEQLVGRLAITDRSGLERIARDVLDENGQRREDATAWKMDTEQLWNLVGGLEGLEAIEHNSLVFVDMAAYLERWYPEALDAAEELRHSAREIQWHVSSLRAGAENGNLDGWFVPYTRNVVATYYVMSRQLLELYENGNLQMLGDLQKAL